jgi:hypothetical protein
MAALAAVWRIEFATICLVHSSLTAMPWRNHILYTSAAEPGPAGSIVSPVPGQVSLPR